MDINTEGEEYEETEIFEEVPGQNPSSAKTDAKDLLVPNSKEINIVKAVYNLYGAIYGMVDQVKIKFLKKYFNEKNIKHSISRNINIKPMLFKELISISSNLGQLVLTSSNLIVVSDKNSSNYIIQVTENEPFIEINIEILSCSLDKINSSNEKISEVLKDYLFTGVSILELLWLFTSGQRIKKYSITEEIDDIFFPESYPYIDLKNLVNAYLESETPILILTGQPGTGKTRLIRYIIKKICETKKDKVTRGVFTSDKSVIQEGEIFLNLLAEDIDLLILEDIDYNLRPRQEGNTSMYNLLSTSNGILSNTMKKKKIILSTNLTNTSKIDSALIRPGRCFDVVNTRPLLQNEAKIILKLLGKDRVLRGKEYTLAELYNDSIDKVIKGAGF